MPRSKSHTPDTLTDLALTVFWSGGYSATSMDDLVNATNVSRHGIYADFGGKKELFVACFDRYQDRVVSPAFETVERPNAKLEHISQYFERQIAAVELIGLPGPGCFVANSATEVAPHDADVLAKVEEHNDRLRIGFASAVRNSLPAGTLSGEAEIAQLAESVLVFATGLWSLSRLVSTAESLRDAAAAFMSSLERRLQ